MKSALLFLIGICLCVHSSAQTSFEFNAKCQSAHEAILGLEFKKAKTLLQAERKSNPKNLIPFYLDNYIDFLSLMLSEEKPSFELLKNNKAIRLNLLEKGDKNSPYYLLTQAEINLQWAFVRIKFNEYLTAALEVNRAFKMLEENQKKFPQFALNKRFLGLLHAAVGTIPDEYKWAIKLIGFEGTVKQGEQELKAALAATQENSIYASFKTETLLLLSFLELNLLNANSYTETILLPLLEQEKKPNPLHVYCYANACIKLGKTDKAIEFIEKNKFGKTVFPFAHLNFLLGQAKLTRLDKDANIPLEAFLKTFKGSSYVKAAYMRLAWHHLISGDKKKYQSCILNLKTNGSTFVDEDKQAKHESEYTEIPNVSLLKSRLLFDGGYYEKALAELNKINSKKVKSVKDNLEIIYRMARIYHKQMNFEKAIHNYQLTLKNGQGYPYYYAANAALQLGLIYEEQKNYSAAKIYFTQCLSLKNHEYQNSISQKAKAGLNRLNN